MDQRSTGWASSLRPIGQLTALHDNKLLTNGSAERLSQWPLTEMQYTSFPPQIHGPHTWGLAPQDAHSAMAK